MNLFNEAIYKNHLEHTASGTKWGKHKYLYITPSGRYVYPEDVRNGQSAGQFRSRQINDQIRSAHVNGTAKTPEDIRRQQINDQIKSAHQGGTSRNPENMRKAKALSDMSGMKLSSTHKLNRLAKEYGTNSKEFKEHLKTLSEGDDEQAKKMLDVINGNKAAKTSGTAAGSKVVSTKTEESKKMGLSDDDLKNMKINTKATNRDEVLRNIALRAIRGDYGNGEDRKAKLGNYYDEVQKRVNEIVKEGSEIKKEEPQQNNSSKPATKSKSSNEKGSTSSKKEYKMEEYKKGDKDFDDENYEKATRLGNTDFHTFKRDDGKYVILEEDMKWVVDEKPSSKMIKNLEAFEDYAQRAQKNNVRYGSKDWERMASEAINGRDFTNVDTGKNKTTKAFQDQTRKYRTNDQIRSAHQGATKEKQGVLYTRKNNGKYTGKRTKVKHYDLTEGSNYLMHWGKKRRSGRYRFGSGDRPYQHESNKRYMRKNSSFSDRRSMTDEELVAAIKRAKNEVDLYRAERDNRSQGQRFVEDVLTSVGKSVIIGAATGGLKYAGKKFVESALGDQELANAMFGNNGGGKKKNKHKD